MSAHAGGPAHLLTGYVLGAGSWAVVGLAALAVLGPDVFQVLLALLLAVAVAAAALLGVLSAVTALHARRSRAAYRHPWPGRMA